MPAADNKAEICSAHAEASGVERHGITGRTDTYAIAGGEVPTLVAFGSDSKLTSPEAGRYMAKQIKGARLALFEHSSHAPFWEEPEEFNRTLEEFLRQVG